MSLRSLSIVVPVFNEEESLGELHRQLEAHLDALGRAYEILYVDDGSQDGSYAVLAELQSQRADVVSVIRLRRNFGQTAALAAGFDAAHGDIVLCMDADLQNDPADIRAMVEKLEEGFDVVSGWRRDRQETFLARRLPSLIANRLISIATGISLHDYGCTLKAYDREVVGQMRLYGEMHRFLPALASWSGASVTELPVNHRARRFGQSKYGIDRTLRVILDLLTVRFLLAYSTRPMQVFGKWGIIALFGGFLAGMTTAITKLLPPYQDVTGNPWLYIFIFLVISGIQLLSIGLLGEITVRTYYESQNKQIYAVRQRLGRSELVRSQEEGSHLRAAERAQ